MVPSIEAHELSKEEELKDFFSPTANAIFGCVYNYDEDNFNIKLFEDFLGVTKGSVSLFFIIEDEEEKEVFLNSILEKILDKIQQKIQKNVSLISYYSSKNGPKEKIILGALQFSRKYLLMLEDSSVFELEKFLKIQIGDTEQRKQRLERVQKIDTELYAPLISGNQEEVRECLIYLSRYFSEHGEKLTREEQERFQKYKDIITEKTGILYEDSWISGEQKEKRVFSEKKIPRDIAIEIFRRVLDIYGIDIPVLVGKYSNIVIGKDGLKIPSSKEYEEISIGRIIELITHEIETHGIVLSNNQVTLGNTQSGEKLAREEGLANSYEYMVAGYSSDNFPTNRYFPRILLGEIFSGDEHKDVLTLLSRLDEVDSEITERKVPDYISRSKRNFPVDFPGVQHKDSLYNRGVKQVMQRIKDGGSIMELYLGKVGFHDIENISEILELDEEDTLVEKLVKIKAKGIILPLMIGEYIKYVLIGKKKKGLSSFYTYLRKKYPFLDIVAFIKNNPIDISSREVQDKIAGILGLIQKNM